MVQSIECAQSRRMSSRIAPRRSTEMIMKRGHRNLAQSLKTSKSSSSTHEKKQAFQDEAVLQTNKVQGGSASSIPFQKSQVIKTPLQPCLIAPRDTPLMNQSSVATSGGRIIVSREIGIASRGLSSDSPGSKRLSKRAWKLQNAPAFHQ